MAYLLSELAQILDGSLSGDDIKIEGVSVPEDQKAGTITILAKSGMLEPLKGSASAYIVPVDFPEISEKPVVRVKDIRRSLIKLLNTFFPEKEKNAVISDKASVAPTAEIEEGVSIGDFAVVGDNVRIGKGTVIYPGVVVGNDVTIGEGCIIYPKVVLYDHTVLKNDVIIQAGAVIGGDGFGFIPGEVHTKIPHKGNVILESRVEIGSNTTIDRGTIGSTVIGEDTKVDNLVQIGHNVRMGRGCFVVSLCGMSGSCTIGDYVILGGQVGVADHLTIGSHVQVAAKSGVSKSIPAGEIYGGYPAVPAKEWARRVAAAGQMADTRRRLIALEKKLEGK